MPARTVEPATDGQKEKIARKLTHHFSFTEPIFNAPSLGLKLDKEIAQWMIESRHIPSRNEWRRKKPTFREVLECSVEYFELLRCFIDRCIKGHEGIKIEEDLRHLSLWPLRGEGIRCNLVEIAGRSFYGPQVFRAVNANCGLIQMVYEYYSDDPLNDKKLRWGNRPCTDKQRQIITDLLPFSTIEWSQIMFSDCVGRSILIKGMTSVNVDEVLLKCAPARSARRNIYKKIKRSLKKIPLVSRRWHPGILE